MGSDTSQWCPATTQGTTGTNRKMGNSIWVWGKTSFFVVDRALKQAAQVGSGASSGDIKTWRLFSAWTTTVFIGFWDHASDTTPSFSAPWMKLGDLSKASDKYPWVTRDFYNPLKLPRAGNCSYIQIGFKVGEILPDLLLICSCVQHVHYFFLFSMVKTWLNIYQWE